MNFLAEINLLSNDASMRVGTYAILLLIVFFVWQILRWFFAGPNTPDPWDQNVNTELDDAKPLCPHCMTAHGKIDHFCPTCGAAVGECTNLMPFLNVLSIGQTMRIGTSEKFKKSRFTIAGFFFIGFSQYLFFAPVYWFRLMQNLRRMPNSAGPRVQTSSPDSEPERHA